ncbi:POK8 protein, partial [Aphelocoma coerulescens]|nr:POK8 protein [Aphelocoma coerulescens]
WTYLGMKVTESRIHPAKMQIRTHVQTVNDVQRLVGDLQWLQTWVGITNEDMAPLIELLQSSSHPAEP